MSKPKNMALVNRNDFEYVTDSGCLSVKVHIKDKAEEERTKASSCPLPFIGIAEIKEHGKELYYRRGPLDIPRSRIIETRIVHCPFQWNGRHSNRLVFKPKSTLR